MRQGLGVFGCTLLLLSIFLPLIIIPQVHADSTTGTVTVAQIEGAKPSEYEINNNNSITSIQFDLSSYTSQSTAGSPESLHLTVVNTKSLSTEYWQVYMVNYTADLGYYTAICRLIHPGGNVSYTKSTNFGSQPTLLNMTLNATYINWYADGVLIANVSNPYSAENIRWFNRQWYLTDRTDSAGSIGWSIYTNPALVPELPSGSTVGNTAGASVVNPTADRRYANNVTFSQVSNLTGISLRAYANFGAQSAMLGIYNDSSTAPGALIGKWNITIYTDNNWYNTTALNVSLASGNYWIAFVSDTANIGVYYTANGAKRYYLDNATYDLSDPFGSGTLNDPGAYYSLVAYWKEPEVPASDTYYINVSISDPENITYTTSTVPVSLSLDGNGTSPAASWNAYFSNGTALYGANQTVSSANMTINENATLTFGVVASDAEGSYDYKQVVFSVNLTSSPANYTITISDDGNGSVNATSPLNLEDGTGFSLLATADANYTFINWVVSGIGNFTANPLALTMNSTLDGKNITAYFSLTPAPTPTATPADSTLLESLNELFLTETLFSWLGVLLLLAIMGVLSFVHNRIVNLMVIPVAVLVGIIYLNAGLGWHCLVMIIVSIGVVVYSAKDL